MKKAFVLFVVLIISIVAAHADVTIYKTYEDYLKDQGVKYSHYTGDMHFTGHYTLFFKDTNGRKKRVRCKKIWGFKQDGELFRIVDGGPMILASKGKVCYYEDGIAYLLMMRFHSKKVLGGEGGMLSAGIGDPIYPISFRLRRPAKSMRPLLEAHPEYKELFDCLMARDIDSRRKCIEDYNDDHTRTWPTMFQPASVPH